ncbi:Gfo/Idh/MocA family protein [Paenibacillus flagellatus]|uniref:Gfo/Idh/MocA family oxidoreductase n=1 Tax=Paenibacillus flagellatus TaxID=2211139 RepID=A0A2V5K8A8_9BACL|nr:Gfo/Idh/MocA family oxidoreductase [Paenibacillus flagellatus]PYI55092.1 gfo/Idh/MocA family oxidoreductase [Paenibacillus flagellatus]
MNAAVVGYGTMGKLFAGLLSGMEGVRLAAICSSSPATEREAEKLGARWYADYREMLERGAELDAVVLALPTDLHREYAVAAARKGLHVICEKPLALTVDDAIAMVEECNRHGVRLFAGHVLRFFPEYASMANRVKAGEIGPVGLARAKRYTVHPKADAWFADESRSGGVVMDLMIHDIDWMRSMLGEATSVYADVRRSPGLQCASAAIRFECGAIATLEAMWGYPGPFEAAAEAAGAGGLLRTDGPPDPTSAARPASAGSAGAEGVAIPGSAAGADPYRLELEHFVRCIRTGEEPIVGAWDGVAAVALACAALESARTGRPVVPKAYASMPGH